MKNKCSGFTLLETVLALAIGALVVISLSNLFQVSLASWEQSMDRSELLQHTRVALQRITMELRYATELVDTRSTPNTLTFNTVNLEDDDSGVEEISYYIDQPVENLHRSVDGGGGQFVAGNSSFWSGQPGDVNVVMLWVGPMKWDGAGGSLVYLNPWDPITDATAVEISMTLQDRDYSPITLTTMVTLRN